MSTRLSLLSLAALLFLSVPAAAQTPGPPLPELGELDEFVLKSLRAWEAPGAVISIVKDGKIVLAKGYGVRDLATGAPMTKDTIFPIQSETKAFTGFTAVLLRDEGKLNLDAPISQYIPGFRMADPVATLETTTRDFLLHRSGLPAHGWLWLTNDQLGRAAAMDRMPYLPLAHPIRTKWTYANMGYVAAANAVERVVGVPWEQFTEERIFRPLGMNRTTFSPAVANADPNHIAGSMIRYGRVASTPMQGATPMTNSTGGIYSTAEDMAKWMLLNLNEGSFGGKQRMKPSSIAEMQTAQMITDRPLPTPEFTSSGYGLGWFVESYRGERLVEHGGNHWGVSSSLGMLPDRELGVSVFVNQDGDLPTFIMLGILDRFIETQTRDWPAAMLPGKKAADGDLIANVAKRDQKRVSGTSLRRPLADYSGRYAHPGYGTITITQQGKQLVAKYDDDVSPLKHWHFEVFVPTERAFGNIWAMHENAKVQFQSDTAGRIVGLTTNTTADGTVFKKTAD